MAFILALCLSQAFGGPISWTSRPISDPVVVSDAKPLVQSILRLVNSLLDTAARKVS